MSDSNLPIPDDELIGAYHDGQLSAADRVRAEQLLASQPEARQLLEDLRALSAALGSVPRLQLGDEFPQRVLRQAERQMLAEAPAPAASTPARRTWRWPQGRRPWVYVAVATAVAVVLMLNRPADKDHLEVLVAHRHDEVAELAQRPAADDSGERRSGVLERAHAAGASDGRHARFSKQDTTADPGGPIRREAAGSGPADEGQPNAGALIVDRLSRLGLEVSTKEIESQVRLAEQPLAGHPIAGGVLVVECGVNQAAWGRTALATVTHTLNSNGIAVVDQPGAADAPVVGNLAVGGAGENEIHPSEPVETFYVVATAPQLAATLDMLQSQQDMIVSVDVRPAPEAPWQQSLQAYNRGSTNGRLRDRGVVSKLEQEEVLKARTDAARHATKLEAGDKADAVLEHRRKAASADSYEAKMLSDMSKAQDKVPAGELPPAAPKASGAAPLTAGKPQAASAPTATSAKLDASGGRQAEPAQRATDSRPLSRAQRLLVQPGTTVLAEQLRLQDRDTRQELLRAEPARDGNARRMNDPSGSRSGNAAPSSSGPATSPVPALQYAGPAEPASGQRAGIDAAGYQRAILVFRAVGSPPSRSAESAVPVAPRD